MPKLAEALVRGSRNLDQMRDDTNRVVDLVRRGFKDMDLSYSDPLYFNTSSTAETWWDFYAHQHLDVRCISEHPSVRFDQQTIIYTTDTKWLNLRRRPLSRGQYALDLGMKGVQIAYDSLDIFLNEAFIRWPTLRQYLQPMLTAGGYV